MSRIVRELRAELLDRHTALGDEILDAPDARAEFVQAGLDRLSPPPEAALRQTPYGATRGIASVRGPSIG